MVTNMLLIISYNLNGQKAGKHLRKAAGDGEHRQTARLASKGFKVNGIHWPFVSLDCERKRDY